MNLLSDMLIYLRKRENLSQQELADKLGMTRSAIGMYETGKREPDLEILEAFADFYNVDMNTLTGRGASAPERKREMTDNDLKVAYFRGADPTLTEEDMDAMWQDAKNFRDFIVERRKKEKNGGQSN